MMKRNILSILSVFLVASLFVMSFVSAVSPTLSSIPEQSRWVADGTTQYKVKIVGDTTMVPSEMVRGVSVIYNAPQIPGYQFNVVSTVIRPPQDDFFTGFNTIDNTASNGFGRLIPGGNGLFNRVGNLAYIWVTVTRTDVTAGPVQAKFTFSEDIDHTFFMGTGFKNNIAPTLISQPFVVVPQGYAVHPNGPTGVSPEDPVKTRCSQVGSIIRRVC